ncbi:MAG: hypothetical protein V2I57_06430 [Xanthomonadales bacterium]|nr:hypothetical protein [Xanthomonadales bacterium]
MKRQDDLIGKTITGIMAVPTEADGPLKIWMLQFSDGTHVEFVSPGARRTLDRLAGGGKRSGEGPGKRRGAPPPAGARSGSRKLRRNATPETRGEPAEIEGFTHPQLALNVA